MSSLRPKPVIATTGKNDLERSVLDAIIDEVRKTIRTTTTFEESKQITLHVVGNEVDDLSAIPHLGDGIPGHGFVLPGRQWLPAQTDQCCGTKIAS